ncbi:C-x8-c-x5-c-x3-h type zinc finger protein [Teratosphaeria destructans]|uniref:C-x8-c-x5-c-x3-h type zinc finger protein n=1 Tax=Teratosphaeria destructans TaxID=418781 RepID=A0A9W7SWH9_9PEZI|nr:C-x8-c-x5-c-x3-h type zinc finger protein [Teratosphaeria destructans]
MAATQYSKGPAFASYTSNPPAVMMQQPTIPPRPFFFIARSNGLLVPLIPADELPFNVRLQGVQRVMPIEQTYGMQYVGSAPYSGMTYKLEQDISAPMQRSTSQPPGGSPNGHVRSQSNNSVNPFAKYLAPDALARQALAQSAGNAAVAAMSRQRTPAAAAAHETATSWRSNYQPSTASQSGPAQTGDKTQSLIDAILSSAGGAEEAARLGYVPKPTITPPSGALPDQDKKEYCTYWIRTGECDYIQQGCLYKHEMPDRATLSKIGFRTLPRWWAEKQTLMQGPVEHRERSLVGPVLKASEWLKQKKSSSDDSSSEDSASQKSSRKSSVSSTQETVKEETIEAEPTPELKPVRALPSYTTSPSLNRARQASTISDLIDFAPTAPSSPSSSDHHTPGLTPANSTGTSPRMPSTPPTPICARTKTPMPTSAPTPEPVKVFVPRGENAEYHIAEATKKRNYQQQLARRGAPVSTLGAVKPLELQIQESQKARTGVKKEQAGLMASRHAHSQAPASAPMLSGTSGGGDGALEVEQRGRSLEKRDGAEKKRSTRTGCRPRRPAGSSGGAAGKGKWKESPGMVPFSKGEVGVGAEKK